MPSKLYLKGDSDPLWLATGMTGPKERPLSAVGIGEDDDLYRELPAEREPREERFRGRQMGPLKPCPYPGCGYPGGLVYCPRCHGAKR